MNSVCPGSLPPPSAPTPRWHCHLACSEQLLGCVDSVERSCPVLDLPEAGHDSLETCGPPLPQGWNQLSFSGFHSRRQENTVCRVWPPKTITFPIPKAESTLSFRTELSRIGDSLLPDLPSSVVLTFRHPTPHWGLHPSLQTRLHSAPSPPSHLFLPHFFKCLPRALSCLSISSFSYQYLPG